MFQELTGFGCGFSGLRDFDVYAPAYRFCGSGFKVEGFAV